MKKIFLFAAAAMAALALNAQTISFSEEDVASAGELDGKVFGTGFTLTVTDQVDGGKQSIDANNTYFGDANAQVDFSYRLKTGGKSTSKNALKLNIPAAGTLKLYIRSAKKTDPSVAVSLSQFGAEIFSHSYNDNEAIDVAGLDSKDPSKTTKVFPVYTCAVAAGEADFAFDNGIYVYGLELVGAQGIDNTNASVKTVKRIVDGQVVIERDGRFFNLLGAEIK